MCCGRQLPITHLSVTRADERQGWARIYDPKTGQFYYHELATNKVQWKPHRRVLGGNHRNRGNNLQFFLLRFHQRCLAQRQHHKLFRPRRQTIETSRERF